jgi:hypothetical protein
MLKTNSNLIIMLLLLIGSCTTVKAPQGSVPRRTDLPADAFGGWITVVHENTSYEGELIAIPDDSLILLNNNGCISLSKDGIINARLIIYNTDYGRFARWTVLGSIGSLSNGFFLIGTLPLWIIVGSSISSGEAKRTNYIVYTGKGWEEINKFARFPQGLPSDFKIEALHPRPR